VSASLRRRAGLCAGNEVVHSGMDIENDLINLKAILEFKYKYLIFIEVIAFLAISSNFPEAYSYNFRDLVRQFSPKLSTTRTKIFSSPLISVDLARISRKYFKLKHRMVPEPA
jgi:hypothetical protein